MIAWLAAVPHGAARVREPAPNGQRARHRLVLPKERWLDAQLAAHGLAKPSAAECAFSQADQEWAKGARITGLVRLSLGAAWDGPLCTWGIEADLLRKFYRNAEDVFSVVVQDCVALCSPVFATARCKTWRAEPGDLQWSCRIHHHGLPWPHSRRRHRASGPMQPCHRGTLTGHLLRHAPRRVRRFGPLGPTAQAPWGGPSLRDPR